MLSHSPELSPAPCYLRGTGQMRVVSVSQMSRVYLKCREYISYVVGAEAWLFSVG